MDEYLFKFYNFPKEKEFFFGYIFNYERLIDKNNSKYSKYKAMLNKCENNKIKYCFFSNKERKFVNKSNETIKDINNIVSAIGTNEDIKGIKEIQSSLTYYILQEEYLKQKEGIILLLTKNGANGNTIDFFENEYIDINTLNQNKCYLYSKK